MTPSTIASSLRELPEYRQVLANLIARDLKVKYQSKSLGFAWSLLAPAIMMGILYAIFSRAFRINMPDYWAFLLAGILPFQFMQEAIVAGSNSIRGSAGLIRKIYVPMEILVIASVTVRAIEFVLQLLVAVVLLLALHRGAPGTLDVAPGAEPPPVHGPIVMDPLKSALVLPGAILLTYMFVLGVAMPLSAWCVIYRDLDHIINITMRVLFYGTPVFWALWLFHGRAWLPLMALNPFTDLLALYRGPLYWGTWPFNEATGGGALTAWAVAAVIAIVALVGGYVLFDRSKRILAEVV